MYGKANTWRCGLKEDRLHASMIHEASMNYRKNVQERQCFGSFACCRGDARASGYMESPVDWKQDARASRCLENGWTRERIHENSVVQAEDVRSGAHGRHDASKDQYRYTTIHEGHDVRTIQVKSGTE